MGWKRGKKYYGVEVTRFKEGALRGWKAEEGPGRPVDLECGVHSLAGKGGPADRTSKGGRPGSTLALATSLRPFLYIVYTRYRSSSDSSLAPEQNRVFLLLLDSCHLEPIPKIRDSD